MFVYRWAAPIASRTYQVEQCNILSHFQLELQIMQFLSKSYRTMSENFAEVNFLTS